MGNRKTTPLKNEKVQSPPPPLKRKRVNSNSLDLNTVHSKRNHLNDIDLRSSPAFNDYFHSRQIYTYDNIFWTPNELPVTIFELNEHRSRPSLPLNYLLA